MNTSKKLLAGLAFAAIAVSGVAQAHQDNARQGPRHVDGGGCHQQAVQHAHQGRFARHCFACQVDARQARQNERIREGWKSGELTRKELHRLRDQQQHIAHMEQRFAADGHFSRSERERLEQALDLASDRIVRARHNAAERGSDRYAAADWHDMNGHNRGHHGH